MTFKEKYNDFLTSKITYRFFNYQEAEDFFKEYMIELKPKWTDYEMVARNCCQKSQGNAVIECRRSDWDISGYALYAEKLDGREVIFSPANTYTVELI